MGNHKMIYSALVLCLIIAALAAPVSAQVIYGQPTAGQFRLTYTSYSVENDAGQTITEASQLLMPLSGFVPLDENFEMKFFIANASNTAEFDGSESDLNGISDARIQFNRSFSDDRMILSLGLNLPTGKKELTDDEQAVTQALSTNYLGFPLRRLGEGFNMNVLFGAATSSDNIRLGGSILYEITGSYDAFEGLVDYDPGNKFSLMGSIDAESGNILWRGSLSYTAYTADQAAGIDVFSQADELGIRLGMTQANEMYTMGISVRYFIRGNNEIFNDAATSELGNELKLYGNEFAGAAYVSWLLLKDLTVSPIIEFRSIGENDQGVGDATIFTIGSGFGYRLGHDVSWDSGIKLTTGSAENGDFSIGGLQLYTGISAVL